MTTDIRKDALNAYLSKGIHDVKGWCVPQLWQTIWPVYKAIGDGPVAEIGVFEGKFLIGLCKTFGTGPDNKAAAIDLFDMQEFNLDGAGVGKLEVVRNNLDGHGIGRDNVTYVKADSLTLRTREADQFVAENGLCKFFSVDGCHEVVHTVNDIEFAMKVTANDGLIAVDDYANPNWPGVQEAVARMYILRDFPFIPLAVTCNKLLLCSYSYHAKYLELIHSYIRTNHPSTHMKFVTRFGYRTLTVQPDFRTWSDLQ
ncbi:class I SAM-dependent methyltransferase [Tropicibacter sp. S64]|uniref:class I SAM-dependent methyltransferase n=1 Tax=Tropicibacter sp. S64 TaxID=3415122 RepID=UPI003C7D929B